MDRYSMEPKHFIWLGILGFIALIVILVVITAEKPKCPLPTVNDVCPVSPS